MSQDERHIGKKPPKELPKRHPAPDEAPPYQASGIFPHQMPFLLSSFVGREREHDELKRLFSRTRLLTLTGPGGCGKTRLAVSAAADLGADFSDGGWLVEFASLSDPALVPQAVAAALGLREQPGRTLTESLVDYL